MKAKLLIDAKATLGEGPSWDADEHLLYWVDIMEKKVHIYDPKSAHSRVIEVDYAVGAVVKRKKGGLVLATDHGFFMLNDETEELSLIHDPEADLPNNRFNDGKCDPAGRFWAGTMHVDEVEPTGSLYMLNTDLSVEKMASQITISNGLAWS